MATKATNGKIWKMMTRETSTNIVYRRLWLQLKMAGSEKSKNGTTQAAAMRPKITFFVINATYLRGLVTAMQRSMVIAKRFALEQYMNVKLILKNAPVCILSKVKPRKLGPHNGRRNVKATHISATERESTNQFAFVCRLGILTIRYITMQFPAAAKATKNQPEIQNHMRNRAK